MATSTGALSKPTKGTIMADTMLQIVRQEAIEAKYSRKKIDVMVRAFITTNPKIQGQMEHGIALLTEWMSKSYYPSKQARIDQLKSVNLAELVLELFVGIAYIMRAELFVSVASKMAGRLGFDDRKEAVLTTAEMLAVLCMTDAFDIGKPDKMASLLLVSRMELDDEIVQCMEQSMYMPPMVCEPLELRGNYDSGYLSFKESVILGKGNHHNGDVCLDVLNTVNRVALKLDTDFLRSVDEEPSKEFTVERAIASAAKKGKVLTEAQAKLVVQDQIEHWERFKPVSARVYMLIHENSDEFYLTNKWDKRGRMYAQGYHITTQGTPYKKACIELAKQEVVTGVPA
jgi:hypothetical protein